MANIIHIQNGMQGKTARQTINADFDALNVQDSTNLAEAKRYAKSEDEKMLRNAKSYTDDKTRLIDLHIDVYKSAVNPSGGTYSAGFEFNNGKSLDFNDGETVATISQGDTIAACRKIGTDESVVGNLYYQFDDGDLYDYVDKTTLIIPAGVENLSFYWYKDYTRSELYTMKSVPVINTKSSYVIYHDGEERPTLPPAGMPVSDYGWYEGIRETSVWMSAKTSTGLTEGLWGAAVRIVGENGTSVTIKGSKANVNEIRQITDANDGDGYIANDTGHLWVYYSGTQTWTDVGEVKGKNGDKAYIHIKYSNDNGQTFTANNGETPGKYIGQYADWTQQDSSDINAYRPWHKVEGDSAITSFVFKRQAERPDAPQGGSYSNPVPSGWSDGIPAGDSIVWMSRRVFYSDNRQTPVWSTPEQMTDTADFDVCFNDQESKPGSPLYHHKDDQGNGWRNEAMEGAVWMATDRCENGVWKGWQISKIKGEQGPQGDTYELRVKKAAANTSYGLDEGFDFNNGLPLDFNNGTSIESFEEGDTVSAIRMFNNEASTEGSLKYKLEYANGRTGNLTDISNDEPVKVETGVKVVFFYWLDKSGKEITSRIIPVISDGSSAFWSFVFKRADSQPGAPTGGSYAEPVPKGWSDGIPAGDSIVWMTGRQFFSDDRTTADWSEPRQMTDTADFDVCYHSGDATPQLPLYHHQSDQGNGWHDIATTEDIWMATDRCKNGTWQGWQINKIKGEEGLSAYEVAVKDGYKGTEEQWLKSLVGEQGLSAYEVYKKNGGTLSEAKWLESLDGEAGLSAYDIYKAKGGTLSEDDWLRSLRGDSVEVQYSVDGSSNWHSVFTTGDFFMRQKVEGQWSNKIRIVGESGTNGAYTDYQFAVSTSLTTAPTSGWQDAPPSVGNGQYLWMRERRVDKDGKAGSWNYVRIGGEKGDDGTSISKVESQYAWGTVNEPHGNWYGYDLKTSAVPYEQYVWTREKITYSDGTTEYTTPHLAHKYVKDGDNGDYTELTYAISAFVSTSSSTTPPSDISDSEWNVAMPNTTSSYPYIWMRSVLCKWNGTSYSRGTAYYTRVTGEKGQSGDGKRGQVVRNRGKYASDVTYYNNDDYLDIVVNSSGNYYHPKGTSVYGVEPPNTSYWIEANQFKFVATEVLFASRSIIENLSLNQAVALDEKGNITLEINGKSGELTAKGVTIEGVLTSRDSQNLMVSQYNGNGEGTIVYYYPIIKKKVLVYRTSSAVKPSSNVGTYANPVPSGWSETPASSGTLYMTSKVFWSDNRDVSTVEWSDVVTISAADAQRTSSEQVKMKEDKFIYDANKVCQGMRTYYYDNKGEISWWITETGTFASPSRLDYYWDIKRLAYFATQNDFLSFVNSHRSDMLAKFPNLDDFSTFQSNSANESKIQALDGFTHMGKTTSANPEALKNANQGYTGLVTQQTSLKATAEGQYFAIFKRYRNGEYLGQITLYA